MSSKFNVIVEILFVWRVNYAWFFPAMFKCLLIRTFATFTF